MPPIISRKDVLAQTQNEDDRLSGICISVLQNVDTRVSKIQALVISPTQIGVTHFSKFFRLYGSSMGLSCHACTESTSLAQDLDQVSRGAHVAIGTSERMGSLLDKILALRIGILRVLVIDVTNQTESGLTRDFLQSLAALTSKTQLVVLCSSFSSAILDLSSRFMNNPVSIQFEESAEDFTSVRHYFVPLVNDNKAAVLCDLCRSLDIDQGRIFCYSTRKVRVTIISFHMLQYLAACRLSGS